jgi:hypothetical protein
MKSYALLTAFALLTGSAFAGEARIGSVKAQILIPVNDANETGGYARGEAFTIVMRFENRGTVDAEIVRPFFGIRYTVAGSPIQIALPGPADRFVVRAGETRHEAVQAVVPRDADVGQRLKAGMVVGLASNLASLSAPFATAPIVRGLDTSDGFRLDTELGGGSNRPRLGSPHPGGGLVPPGSNPRGEPVLRRP